MPQLKKILHVEDEADIREVVKVILENLGEFVVESCDSCEEAVAKGPGFAPDLIILDVMMPGVDGPATLRALHEIPELAEVPVVFMTAKTQGHEVEMLRTRGAIDVIMKPFDPMTLTEQILDIWSRYNG